MKVRTVPRSRAGRRPGLSPRTVADRHDLAIADVYRALAYYHEHPDEMAAIRTRRERTLEEASDEPNIATGPDDLEKNHDKREERTNST